jgi:hypothetical protein
MLQRIALYLTLGLLCDALGHDVRSTAFWCFMGLFWAADVLGRHEGFDDAIELSQSVLHKANDMLKEAKALRAMKGYTDDQDV